MSSARSERTPPRLTTPDANGSRTRSVVDWITIGAFLVAILAPCADQQVRDEEERGPAPELRAPAPRPAAPTDLRTLTEYPAQYERYFKDMFGLRDVLLRGNSIVKLFGYGVPPTEQVIVGEQGWLFYTGDSSVEVYRGLLPFSQKDLEGWRTMLEARRDYLRARGIDYLFVIAPNKESIYPEYMPARFNVVHAQTRLDQLSDFMRAHSDVGFLDLRPTLLDKKSEDVHEDWLYVRLGTHWNGRGGYEGYRAIVDRLPQRFRTMPPFERADLDLTISPGYGDTWGAHMYIEDLLPQRITNYSPPEDARVRRSVETNWGRNRELIIEKDDPALPRALLFHDSFGPFVEDLLGRHFSSLLCSWRDDFDTATIERAQPDIVIELFVERILVMKGSSEPTPTFREPDREDFERSSDVRWKLDPAAAAGGLESDGRTRIAHAADGCFSIERDATNDRIFIPEFDRSNARSLVIRVDAETAASTTATVLFLAEGQTDYKHRFRTRALLRRGSNRVYMRLDPHRFHGRLVLHLGVALRDFRLCGLEIRAVD